MSEGNGKMVLRHGTVPIGAYFGEPWPSGVCEAPDAIQWPTPVGLPCGWCDEAIEDGDQGVFQSWPEGQRPIHKECNLRSVMGGIGHFENHEYWCKGPGQDTDGGRTKRQSAIEVWKGFVEGRFFPGR